MNEFIYEEVTTESGLVMIKRTDENGVESWIPADSANSDYRAYLESLNDDTETE